MLHFTFRKQTFLLLAFFVAVFVLITISNQPHRISTKIYYYFNPHEAINCYRARVPSLQDILDVEVRKGKSIFFHETSCKSYLSGKIVINSRQACAVESAAKMNPNLDVYLLYSSPGVFNFQGTASDRFLQALLSYPNVKILHVDFARFTEATLVEDLFKNGDLEASKYPVSHASDILRYLTLWRYGGIYLDLDVLVIKSLEGLPLNYAASESAWNVAAGVLSFSETGPGHKMAESCLEDLKYHFTGRAWGSNGPGVITRLLTSVCHSDSTCDMYSRNCDGFVVYPSKVFYPVPWSIWNWYFQKEHLEEVKNMSRDSYTLHIWNRDSSKAKLPLNSGSAYIDYAKNYCPKVYAECGEFF